MLLVNNPGTWEAVYPPLRHAAWHGWTPTDLIFPFFLFVVGITTELSLQRRANGGAGDAAIRRHVLIRAAIIVGAGLALHAFPFVPLTRITEIRIPGVLQRIGVCYAIAALIAWRRPTRSLAVVVAALLLGYWAILTLVTPPGQDSPTIDIPDRTIAAYLDRLLLDGHLWAVTRRWDPEGPLSTIGALATVLLGIGAARFSQSHADLRQRQKWFLVVGLFATLGGLGWGLVLPINKNLWTSSYVIFSAGAALLLLAAVDAAAGMRSARPLVRPLVIYGSNPLIAFVGSGLMARIIGSLVVVPWAGDDLPLQQVIFRAGYSSWLPPAAASLAYAVSFVGCWYLVLWWLDRRGWYLKA